MQSGQIPEQTQQTPSASPDPGTTLTKAVMRAAGFLGISQAIDADGVAGASTQMRLGLY